MSVTTVNPFLDGFIDARAASGASFLGLRNAASGFSATDSVAYAWVQVEAYTVTDKYKTFSRMGWLFDSSAIGTDTPTAGTVKVTVQAVDEKSWGDTLSLVGFSPAGTVNIITDDYSAFGGVLLSDDLIDIDTLSPEDEITFNLNAAGLAALDGSGNTGFGIRMTQDQAGVAIGWGSSYRDKVTFYTRLDATRQPELSVTHLNTTRAGQVFWAELQVPLDPAREGQVFWASMETPTQAGEVEPVIALFDDLPAAGGSLLARIPDYVSWTVTRDSGGRHQLTLVGPLSSQWTDDLLRGRVIHTVLHNGETFDWRIAEVEDGVGPGKPPVVVVTGDPIEIDLMDIGPIRSVTTGGLTSYAVSWSNQTPTEIIDEIVLPALTAYGITWINRGTVESSALLTGSAEMVTPAELLRIIEDATGLTFRLRPYGLTAYYLDLVESLAPNADVARIRSGVNLMELSRARSGEDLATVVIARGGEYGGVRAPVGIAAWEVTGIYGYGSLYLVTLEDTEGGDGPVAMDGQFVGNGLPTTNPKRIPTHYLRFPGGTLEEILDTEAPGDFILGDVSGLSEGDTVYISPDSSGTLLTELASPTGINLYGRVARYFDIDDVTGRSNLTDNPLGDEWAADPFCMAGVVDGQTSTVYVDLKDCIPGYVISAGMSYAVYRAGWNEVYVFSVVVGDTVDQYGAASIEVSFPLSPLYDEQVLVFFPQASYLPDGWTSVGNVGAIVAKRPSDQDETPLSCTLSWVANWYMGGKLSGLTPGDRIYAGDKILLGGTTEVVAVSDGLADDSGECVIQWNKYAGALSAPVAVTVSRTIPPVQTGQSYAITFPPYPTQNPGIYRPKLQGPSATVRYIEGITTLWASCALHLRNHYDSAVTVEAGGLVRPPGIALWNGSAEVATAESDDVTLPADSETTIITRTSYDLSAAGTYSVRALGMVADASFGTATEYAFAPVATLLWMELSLSNEEPTDTTPLSGASARVLHQIANRTLLRRHLWPSAIETTHRELVDHWGLTPPEIKLSLGQTVRVTEPTLGVDVELEVQRIRWRSTDLENPTYVLGTPEPDLAERLVREIDNAASSSGSASGSSSSSSSTVTSSRYSNAEVDAFFRASFVDLTGTTETLELGHAQKWVNLTNANPISLIVPDDTAVAFLVGARITIEQGGAGIVSVEPDSGVTINSRGSRFDLAGQGAVARLVKKASNEWTLEGDVTT